MRIMRIKGIIRTNVPSSAFLYGDNKCFVITDEDSSEEGDEESDGGGEKANQQASLHHHLGLAEKRGIITMIDDGIGLRVVYTSDHYLQPFVTWFQVLLVEC